MHMRANTHSHPLDGTCKSTLVSDTCSGCSIRPLMHCSVNGISPAGLLAKGSFLLLFLPAGLFRHLWLACCGAVRDGESTAWTHRKWMRAEVCFWKVVMIVLCRELPQK